MIIGLDTVRTNLVFGYDANDKSYRFYKGEPTTNLIPSPSINSLPTYGNWWGTYNTNQYCGNNGCNQYWDIPAISNITNNIVTTVSAHPIRTYDVINPQTTGGGVIAGDHYFAKVLSSTQFTLHAYNSSQDGSQGYINPVTGTYKVYDSVALDQRISINSTNFPTKWFGAPHMANSGLVKEIRRNGFKNPYTNELSDCMRLHVTRPVGVDGMAYGVDTTVVVGIPATTSFWYRSVTATAVGKSVSFSHYNYGNPGGADSFGSSFTLGEIGEWKKFSFTFTPSRDTLISYWFPQGDYVYDLDIANIQIEQKSHSTQFVTGSRGQTNSLIDLKRNATIDLSNVSFSSSAHPAFDGTDDYITAGNISQTNFGLDNFTLECIIKIDENIVVGASYYKGIITKKGSGGYDAGFGIYFNTGQGRFLWSTANGSTSSEIWSSNTWNQLKGKYAHIVMIRQNGITNNGCFYINGVYESISSSATILNVDNSYNLTIGGSSSLYGPYFFHGEIPVAKIYNKALSVDEVLKNYNSYKNRFNIG